MWDLDSSRHRASSRDSQVHAVSILDHDAAGGLNSHSCIVDSGQFSDSSVSHRYCQFRHQPWVFLYWPSQFLSPPTGVARCPPWGAMINNPNMKNIPLILILLASLCGFHAAKASDDTASLTLLVNTLNSTDNPNVRVILMRGMLSGLSGRRNVDPPPGWKELSKKLSSSEHAEERALLQQLSQIFGDTEAMQEALTLVQDRNADVSARKTALRSLLAQQNEQVSMELVELLDDPELCLDAIRGYASIENASAPGILLGRYENYDDSLKRAVIETLATRKGYAVALLTAIESGKIQRKEIPAHVARSLDVLLGDRFVKVFGEVEDLSADRAKLMAKYKAMCTPEAMEKADASRVYGLEIEELLSPNDINFLIWKDTLIEEHIIGVPGDQFIKQYLPRPDIHEVRLAKEFVKFNERCFIRLLGDMRSYNFVVDMTPDFDQIQYRIRAIDFDQQSFEGRKNIYFPQYYKENIPYVELAMKHMSPETVEQYKTEERALMAKRLRLAKYQVKELMHAMIHDELSLPEHIHHLKMDLYNYYGGKDFLKCKNMGEVVQVCLDTISSH